MARKSSPWQVEPHHFFDESEVARDLFASLIGADADGVAIIPSVSYGVGIAAANLGLRREDRVLVLEEQFPSNYYPWKAAADRTGAEIVIVTRPGDLDWTTAILDALDERTAVVAVANGHWTDGSIVDLAAVRVATSAVDAALVVDATQSVGAHPLSVADVEPDYLVTSAYKWLLGPYSFGFLYAAPHRRQGVPLEFNWMTRDGAEDFGGLVNYHDGFQRGARRYDVGERSNFALTPMVVAALTQIREWTVAEIARYGSELTAIAESHADRLGLLSIPAKQRVSCLMGVRFPEGVPPGLAGELADEGVYVSVRGDSIRISAHVFNTAADIDRLFGLIGPRI